MFILYSLLCKHLNEGIYKFSTKFMAYRAFYKPNTWSHVSRVVSACYAGILLAECNYIICYPFTDISGDFNHNLRSPNMFYRPDTFSLYCESVFERPL